MSLAPEYPLSQKVIVHAKRAMVDLRRISRRREIREDLVPRASSGRSVGPGYSSRLAEFVLDPNGWRPEVAACIWHFDHQRQMIVDDTSAAGADDRGRFALLDNRRTIHVETGIKCVTIIDRGFREAMLGKVGESLSL